MNATIFYNLLYRPVPTISRTEFCTHDPFNACYTSSTTECTVNLIEYRREVIKSTSSIVIA